MIWKILIILVISMIPFIELRGAVPIAVGMELGLPEWLVLIIATVGNIIPIPIIYLFAQKFLKWGKKKKRLKKFCNFWLLEGEKAGKNILKKMKSGIYLALFLFVAVPIPGTGAWAGTLAASILKLDFKKTMIAISAGIIAAGAISILASLGLTDWLFSK